MLNRFDTGFDAGVKDKNRCFFRKLINGCGDVVTGIHFIGEPFAFTGYEDGAFTANGFPDQIGFLLLHGRVNLDLIHIDCGAAELLNHFDTVTGAANLVRGYQPFQIGSNLGNHFFIRSETSGGDNDSRTCYCFFVCLVEQDFDAGYLTVFFGNFLDIRVHK
ncbi:hypothetical protein D3C73_906440 [compost metagenome]